MAELGKIQVDPFDSSEEEQTQRDIYICTFSMLSRITSVDGQVSKDEIQMIDKFMRNVLGLDTERRAFAIQVFNDARRSESTFEQYAEQYFELLSDKPKMLEWMVDVLLKVSCVDRNYSEGEKQLVESARKIFGISDAKFEELKSRYIKKSAPEKQQEQKAEQKSEVKAESKAIAPAGSPFEILRLTESASNEEIQQQYKSLCDEYNPSRIVELGLPEEFVELAEEKSRQFQKAFRALKTQRGF